MIIYPTAGAGGVEEQQKKYVLTYTFMARSIH
jgi:hypothetical protein